MYLAFLNNCQRLEPKNLHFRWMTRDALEELENIFDKKQVKEFTHLKGKRKRFRQRPTRLAYIKVSIIAQQSLVSHQPIIKCNKSSWVGFNIL